jgi:uncharacterized protein (DUF1501 family)
MTGISRRAFLKASGVGITALMAPPLFARSAFAAPGDAPVLVSIFLRFGTDGLSHVAPIDDPWYQTIRPTIGMRSSGDPSRIAVPLANVYNRAVNTAGPLHSPRTSPDPDYHFFHLNDQMKEMRDYLYDQQSATYNGHGVGMAIVHGMGGSGSHSHFTAQDAVERADPSDALGDGWLQRVAEQLDLLGRPLGSPPALTGIALSGKPIEALNGQIRGYHTNFESIDAFQLEPGTWDAERVAVLERAYGSMGTSPPGSAVPVSDLGRGSGADVFSALQKVSDVADDPSGHDYDFKATDPMTSDPMSGSNGLNFSARLRDAARLIKAGSALGTRVLAIDMPGGWDYHSNIVDRTVPHAKLLSQGLARFYKDLGDEGQRVVTIVMSEFGRTAYENGGDMDADPPLAPGTDHGDGGIAYVIGGGVAGNRVLCRESKSAPDERAGWPGLAPGQLSRHGNYAIPFVNPDDPSNLYVKGERDLKATIDFRDVYGDVLRNHMSLTDGVTQQERDDADAAVKAILQDYDRRPLPDGGCFDAD